MGNLSNGFTGRPSRQGNFESAADAIRRQHEEIDSRARARQRTGEARPPSSAASTVDASARTVRPAHARDLGLGLGAASLRSLGTQGPNRADGGPADRRWAWMEVNLSAVRHNVAQVRRVVQPRVQVAAVVSADAYGHGAVEVSKAAVGAGADRLAVATVSEAVQLRDAGIAVPILLLQQPPAASIPVLVERAITPTVHETDFAVAYAEAADLRGAKAPYHLALNTGMNRIGVHYEDAVEFLSQVDFHRALVLEGVFTHFATADCPETLDFQIQARRFVDAVTCIEQAGFDPGLVHAAGSAATFRFPDVHFDMVRVGAALYGFHPCPETRDRVDLRPAMSVHARITHVRAVPMSEGVSYGLHYRSPGSVKICTIPIGFADGLQRGLSGATDIILGGRYHRQVGNICMDQCMFEVDQRSSAARERLDPQVGDEVLVVGEQGIAQVTIDEMAAKLGTVHYEVALGFGRRLERIYV